MILGIDLGNTQTTIALIKNEKVTSIGTVDSSLNLRDYKIALRKVFTQRQRMLKNLQGAVLCSVVPHLNKVVEQVLKSQAKVSTKIMGQDIKVPIKNRYRNPRQVGQDRLVVAYAARELYGAPAIIIDFGTAITFDFVNDEGDYEGGLIIPGILLSLESLFNKAALLPKIENVKAPTSLVGKTTHESILSGVFHGYGAMSEGLIEMISEKVTGDPQVIVTGGHTNLMKKYIKKQAYTVDKALVFKGMEKIFLNTAK